MSMCVKCKVSFTKKDKAISCHTKKKLDLLFDNSLHTSDKRRTKNITISCLLEKNNYSLLSLRLEWFVENQSLLLATLEKTKLVKL